MNRFVIAFVFFLSCIKVLAESKSDTLSTNIFERGAGMVETVLDLVTFEKGRSAFTIYPAAGYSPRTGLEIGVMPVWRLNPIDKVNGRPSSLASSFQISTKGMYEVNLDLLSFLPNNWLLRSKLKYLFLPDEFYGLGNMEKLEPFSQYDLNSFTASVDFAKGIGKRWYGGLRLDINYNLNDNIEGDKLTEDIVGYKGGWSNGLGPMLAFDTRNDVLYPSGGWFVSASYLWYSSVFASDFKFGLATIDTRKYISLVKDKSILAWQGVVSMSTGDVPFYKLPGIGGKHLLRGIPHPHKYLDNNAWYTQLELRQHLWWRLGLVGFIGTGRVLPDVNDSWFSDLHAVGGFGFRFRVLPEDGLNFRIDYGVSSHNESGLFLTIREAF